MKTDMPPLKAGGAISELKCCYNYGTVLIIYFKQPIQFTKDYTMSFISSSSTKEHFNFS